MNKTAKILMRGVLPFLYLITFSWVGYLLYLSSKIIRAAGFALLLNPYSAKKEFQNFFSVFLSIRDGLKYK